LRRDAVALAGTEGATIPVMTTEALSQDACVFYVRALNALADARVPFLVGGAYAIERYTGLARNTKDLDLFVRSRDCDPALAALAAAGHETEVAFPHWLAKAHCGEDTVDVIFSSGNGFAEVDDVWFEHAVDDVVLGVPVKLCPPEETIWSKAFIMERERYDGADIAHLVRACADDLNWPRLLRRFGAHWHVLLSHLVLFTFIYPSERARVPAWVFRELLGRMQNEVEQPPAADRLCRGTLISRAQYLVDVECWGYRDARLAAPATMSPEELAVWTAAIDDGAQPRPSGDPDAQPAEARPHADRGAR
jgi:hypothetical protein